MDEIVKAALKKWPTVPHCYGWLALDARGQWFMRDDRIQRAGPFPRVKGSVIRHDKLLEFIHRNYECDAQGCWFFQNGPQRVYVELEAAPLVWRVSWAVDTVRVQAHTGEDAIVLAGWLDELGRLFTAVRTRSRHRIARSGHVLTHRAIEQACGPPEPRRSNRCPGALAMLLKPEPVSARPH